MRKLQAVLIILALLLCGCGKDTDGLDPAMSLRTRLLNSQGCSFDMTITADYGDSLQVFEMNCAFDQQGNMTFSVLRPDTIAGITGNVSNTGGQLTFDDHVLMFSLLADGQITPVSAPWILIKSLRGGYIKAFTSVENGNRISIDDSYSEDALHLDIWLDCDNIPIRSEILWQGRRILSLDVKNFVFL